MVGEMPVNHVLNIKESSLTPKMLSYCENRARGETKAKSYRRAYKSKGKPTTVANKGYQLEKRDDIKAMISSYEEAIEWNTRYSLAQTKALVIARLTKEALSDESSPSARINALKALGTVAGVDAFVHRSETTVIKDSATARNELMEQLKKAMGDSMRTVDEADDADAQALMNLINNSQPNESSSLANPPVPDPDSDQIDGSHPLHSNPDKRISVNSDTKPSIQALNEGQLATLPDRIENEEGEGVQKSHPDWEELDTETPPLHVSEQKG